MAKDLREIVGALKISSMLERIGDYAKNVAKRTVTLVEMPPVPSAQTVARLGRLSQEMVKDVLDAYIAREFEKAEAVRQRDKEVDALYTSIFRELLTYMMEDPRSITRLHAPFVRRQELRTGRRPCHQHRRGGRIPRRRAALPMRNGRRTTSPASPCRPMPERTGSFG